MIRDQCRADCQCTFCDQPPKNNADTTSLRITQANIDGSGLCKDELYMKSLQESIRARSLLASTKNATKFIPDEQLVSSKKRREAKEAANASQLVPLRRRDRLEELLLLEHKARLREEARLRAERRAAGLPEDDDEIVEEAPVEEEIVPQTPASVASSDQQRRLSGGSTPSSRCSADHDLHATLRSIKEIVEEEGDQNPQKPLSKGQIYKLRKLVHEQGKKSKALVAECPNQPHICNHCFAVNVQAKHLCPQMQNSVAFSQTGKVINPDAGVKFGTTAKRDLNGSYSQNQISGNDIATNKTRLANYNPHPHGTGVVFLPIVPNSHKPGDSTIAGKSVRFQPTFNNNIGSDDGVENDMQYPGSTYNVYDERAGPKVSFPSSVGGDSGNGSPVAAAAGGAAGAAKATVTAPEDGDKKQNPSSSSALWRTTNQVRESDMDRFLEFQKNMNANSRRVYDSTATRNAPAAYAAE